MDPVLERALRLDARLVDAARQVKVLSTLAWPEDQATRFLSAWRRRRPRLPDPREARPPLHEVVAEFDAIAAACDPDDPLHRFLQRTARSYSMAARMLASAGTRAFSEL